MEKFKDRLRHLRESKKLTQKKLAKLIKVAESTISMYERGEREPSFEITVKLANIFNVSTDYLLGRTDDPRPNEKTDHDNMAGDDYIMEQKLKTIELIKQAPEEDIRIIYEIIKKITKPNEKTH